MRELKVFSGVNTSNLPFFDAYVCECGGMWRVDGENFIVTIPEQDIPGLYEISGVEVLS